MANSRLYIYDKKTNSACCIARGSSTWFNGGSSNDHYNDFFDYAEEYVMNIRETRYALKMEHEIYAISPKPKVFYEK